MIGPCHGSAAGVWTKEIERLSLGHRPHLSDSAFELRVAFTSQLPMNKLNLLPIPRVEKITPSDFQTHYMGPNRPVVFKDLASSWPATRKWTPEYLKQKCGDLQVKVYDTSYAQLGKHYMSSLRKMSFKEYLDLVTNSSVDLRMFLFDILKEAPELREDLMFPSVASGFSKRFIFLFFGCKSSVTPMHYDVDMSHVFHTVFYGKKRVVLFPYEESRNLYKHPFNTRSYIDVDNPDFDKFPRLRDVTGYQEILYPRETLFIPSGYYHYVVYEEGGYAVSMRHPSQSLARRVRGYINILFCLPIDKIINRLLPDQWFRLKEKRASH